MVSTTLELDYTEPTQVSDGWHLLGGLIPVQQRRGLGCAERSPTPLLAKQGQNNTAPLLVMLTNCDPARPPPSAAF